MAYSKTVKGDSNQANETGFNHNRFILNTGAGFTVFAVFLVLLVVAAFLYMALRHGDILQALVIGSFCGIFGCGWFWLVNFTRRTLAHTNTYIAVSRYEKERAWLESRVAVRAEQYVLYLDEDDKLQFMGTTQITENRHFPAQIESPKEVDQSRGILENWDLGLSGRAIEKLMKEKGVEYRDIQRTLDLFRPGWNKRGKGKVEEYVDADEEIPL
jgi:hypothetical protein